LLSVLFSRTGGGSLIVAGDGLDEYGVELLAAGADAIGVGEDSLVRACSDEVPPLKACVTK
jgi:hypothetical protein